MSAIELKKLLMHKIAEIDDVSFLKALKTILDSKTESKILSLTSEQRSEINESMEEIEQGLFIDQVELDKEFDKWLSAR
jgi:predicted transcriptional regulator